MTSSAPGDGHIHWAAQAVTFYAPAVWGFETSDELLNWAVASPRDFWDQLADKVGATGLDHLELCFEPGDWRTLRSAYGGSAEVVSHLARRRLTVSGSYQGGGHRLESAITDPLLVQQLTEEMREHAAFIRGCGGALVMMGPPRRFPLTQDYAADLPGDVVVKLADALNRLGAAAAEEGVAFAVHTEAYSCLARNDDVAAVLAATDPGLVGLCVDCGHVTLDGGDPAGMLRDAGSRVKAVHWKDCIGERQWLPGDGEVSHEMMMEQFRTAGEGITDWRAVTEALKQIGFAGFAAAESDLASDPIRETQEVVRFFDRELSEIYR